MVVQATSFKRGIANDFCERIWSAHGGTHGAVIWVVHVNPNGRKDKMLQCKHANLIKRSQFAGNNVV